MRLPRLALEPGSPHGSFLAEMETASLLALVSASLHGTASRPPPVPSSTAGTPGTWLAHDPLSQHLRSPHLHPRPALRKGGASRLAYATDAGLGVLQGLPWPEKTRGSRDSPASHPAATPGFEGGAAQGPRSAPPQGWTQRGGRVAEVRPEYREGARARGRRSCAEGGRAGGQQRSVHRSGQTFYYKVLQVDTGRPLAYGL